MEECVQKYGIIGQEIHWMGEEIPKGETYKLYGDVDGEVEIQAIEEHGDFMRVPDGDAPKGEVCINGGFFYTAKHRPLEGGHPKTESYIEHARRLDARSIVTCFQGDLETNDPAPTAQLRRLRILLSVIEYSRWHFRVMGVSI